MDYQQELFIDAIMSTKPPFELCVRKECNFMIKFCGNQWNPDWCWDREYLKQLSTDGLYALYKLMKERK